MIRPQTPSAPNRYSRLFSPVEPPFDANAMARLGCSMDKVLPSKRDPRILAGYTYFGQFIDHDLTRDDTDLDKAGELAPCETENHRTPWLDLDHLYGNGPCSPTHRHLYEDDGASFRLGKICVNGEPFDLPLDTTEMPQLADNRNKENMIVRQVHVMFLKLHNAAVKELPAKLPAQERFRRARDRVCWQYQWLVRHDFLLTICDRDVYNDIIENHRCLIDWSAHGFSIPVEFSQAAFRFGHSLVRDSYILNLSPTGAPPSPHPGVSLEELFRSAYEAKPLSVNRHVDWNRFLGGYAGKTSSAFVGRHEFAALIDTSIAKPLFNLPPSTIRPFVENLAPKETKELPVRTLDRGAKTGLATGQYVAEKFGVAPLTFDPTCDSWNVLERLDLKDRTPLWYYVLLEAEVQHDGGSLGTVGSRLVAEVIEGSLRADPGSFLSQNHSEWVPPPWIGPKGKPIAIKTLLDLAAVVGFATPRSV